MSRFIFMVWSVALFAVIVNSAQVSSHPLERSKRQGDLSSLLLQGLLNQGGAQAAAGQGSSNSILDFVKGYAVKKVLGDGVVGQVLGSSLGFGQAFATTTPAPSLWNRLFGQATTLPPTPLTIELKAGFWKKLFGGATIARTTTTTTTTTPAPSIWNKILNLGKGSTLVPSNSDIEKAGFTNISSGSSRAPEELSSVTKSPSLLLSLANRIMG